MVGMIITWSIPMRSISLSLALGSYAPGCSTYFFCSGVSPICCSLRAIFFVICGPARQIGLYPGKS